MSSSLLWCGKGFSDRREKMQQGVDDVYDSYDSYDLTMSIKKTEVASTWKALKGAYHYSEWSTIASCKQVHLPWKHTVYSCAHWWWSKDWSPKLVQQLADYVKVFSDRSGIRLDIKLKVYRSVVLPTLLYACETWTIYQHHAKRLNHFHTSCLRKFLKIKW